MTAPTSGQDPAAPAPGPVAVRFVALTRPVLVALRDSDLTAASTLAGVEFPEFFVGDSELWLWRLRLSDIAANPEAARWIARAAVDEPGGFVVGHAGFHGPPNDAGMVEVGYTVVPEYRRRGYARAMLTALLRRAAGRAAGPRGTRVDQPGQHGLAGHDRRLRLRARRRAVG